MLQTTKTITISISFLFIFLLTSISIAQEVTLINQEFWRLSGGKGEWQLDPITGEKCLTVTGFGKEDDANYWTMPYTFLPNQTYRISCLVRTSPGVTGANILIGSSLANRDVWVSQSWEQKEFIFQTPVKTNDAYLRFGQWCVNGTVWFRDIQVTEVQPVYQKRLNYTLGAGEIFEKGIYRASTNFRGVESNSSRYLQEHQSWFNTNRFVMSSGNYIIFVHRVNEKDQLGGEVKVNIGYHVMGTCRIEASQDNKEWQSVGSLDAKGEKSYLLPSTLFPAEVLFIRLRAEGIAANFQIYQYEYQARIPATIPNFAGSTQWVDVLKSSDQLAIRLESLGATGTGDAAPAIIRVENRSSQAQTLDVQIESERRTEKKAVTVAAKSSQIVQLPIDDSAIPAERKTVTVRQRGAREIAFKASSTWQLPYLQRADYGQLLNEDQTAVLWWTDGMRKISQDRLAPAAPLSPAISLCSAKNEYEPVQLVIRPRQNLTKVTVKLNPLRHATSGLLPTDILMVDYVFVQHPTDAFGQMGWWPDPLPPIPNAFSIPAGKNQPLWILVHVPAEARAGDYQGSISVSAGNWQKIIPIKMHVWNFTLPKQNHLQSSCGFDPALVARYHRVAEGENLNSLLEKYFKSFLNIVSRPMIHLSLIGL